MVYVDKEQIANKQISSIKVVSSLEPIEINNLSDNSYSVMNLNLLMSASPMQYKVISISII